MMKVVQKDYIFYDYVISSLFYVSVTAKGYHVYVFQKHI